MDKYFFKEFKNTIGYIIFRKILYVYIIIAIILTSYQIYSELNSSKKEIQKNIANIKDRYYKEISYAVWFENTESLKKRLNKIILNEKDTSGISITNTKGEIIILSGLVENKLRNSLFVKPINNKYSFSSNQLVSNKFEILNEIENDKEKIANITFYSTQQTVFEHTKETIFLIIFNILFSIFIFWVLTIYATNKYLSAPLKSLIDGIKSFESHDDEKVAIKLELKNMKELSILADSFNRMSGKISEDIINLRQLTMIQNQQKKALEEANRTKDDFLANMSHELKTPLNSVNLISSVMMKNKEKNLTEKDLKNLKIINNCGNDLLYLITDILDLSKLEAGKMQLNYEMLNLNSMIEELKDMFAPQAKDKNIDFYVKIDDKIEEIYTDKSRLAQVIKNLLSNSLKFVHKGGIRLIVQEVNNSIEIKISDDGIGIPQDKLEHIFDRFKQADGSTTRQYGGTGLGLAICKDIINLFNGNIDIKSTVDVGTTVSITIPKNLNKAKANPSDNSNQIENSNLEDEDYDFLFSEPSKEQKIQDESINKKLLVLNNDPITFMGLIIELNKYYQVQQVNNFNDFEKKVTKEEFDLVVIDNELLDENTISKIIKLDLNLVITSNIDSNIDNRIKKIAKAFIEKPFEKNSAVTSIKELLN